MKLEDIFPFEYSGGGYFRQKGIPVGETAAILHGNEAAEFVFLATVAAYSFETFTIQDWKERKASK